MNDQSSKTSLWKFVFYAGVGLFVVSFLLPVTEVMEQDILGWQAAVFSIAFLAESPFKIGALYMSLLGLSNLVVITVAAKVFLKREVGTVLLSMLVVSTVAVCAYFVLASFRSELAELFVGYYVWAASYVVITASILLMRRVK